MPVPCRRAVPSLGNNLIRFRPVVAVRVTGPQHTDLSDGLLDTGADDTVFTEGLAALLGVDLTKAPEIQISLAGRPKPLRCRYAQVQLRITDGLHETYEWNAVVGFVPGPLHYNLLGQAGFLQYFLAEFD